MSENLPITIPQIDEDEETYWEAVDAEADDELTSDLRQALESGDAEAPVMTPAFFDETWPLRNIAIDCAEDILGDLLVLLGAALKRDTEQCAEIADRAFALFAKQHVKNHINEYVSIVHQRKQEEANEF